MNALDCQREERATILGVGISVINVERAVSIIDNWITTRDPHYICVTGVHGVMESWADETVAAIHNEAGLVTPDGMPLVWMARQLGYTQIQRVYGPDLMRTITAISPKRGYRHFYYGGAPGLAERLRDALTSTHPGLNVVGVLSPPFRQLTPEEDAAVVAEINATRPDIVWIGLSTPKQERWMAAHLGRINTPVMIGVGAAFDFLASTKKQAPLWMQRNGLEWLYRLCTEPHRLWRRYARIVPSFLVLAVAQLLYFRWRKVIHRLRLV
jgi:N-acetylglucosaminyldiphosphoundecaprenol N-acetyl-beta-D-mannosaminyltransferase